MTDQATLAKALWAADVLGGDCFTGWEELGAAGHEAYERDAKHLTEVLSKLGLAITKRKDT